MASGRGRSRRTLLGGILAATGLASAGFAAKLGPWPDDAASPADGALSKGDSLVSSTFFLDGYTVHSNGKGAERSKGDQSLLRGTLRTGTGERAGELFASAFTMPGPADDDAPQTSRMEMQHLHLADGAIFAMGTVFARADIPNIYTVLGGTGRYSGARGSYRFDDNPVVARPEGSAHIVLDLILDPVVAGRSTGRQL